MNPNRAKRKKYFINPRFQLAFIAYNIGVSFVVSAVFYGAIRYFFWKLAGFGAAAGLPPEHVFFEFIGEQVRLMNTVFAVTLLATVVLLFMHGMFLSHRIAGPLYRLRMHMSKIADGEPPSEVRFRKKDFFPELADAFNRQLKKNGEKGKAA